MPPPPLPTTLLAHGRGREESHHDFKVLVKYINLVSVLVGTLIGIVIGFTFALNIASRFSSNASGANSSSSSHLSEYHISATQNDTGTTTTWMMEQMKSLAATMSATAPTSDTPTEQRKKTRQYADQMYLEQHPALLMAEGKEEEEEPGMNNNRTRIVIVGMSATVRPNNTPYSRTPARYSHCFHGDTIEDKYCQEAIGDLCQVLSWSQQLRRLADALEQYNTAWKFDIKIVVEPDMVNVWTPMLQPVNVSVQAVDPEMLKALEQGSLQFNPGRMKGQENLRNSLFWHAESVRGEMWSMKASAWLNHEEEYDYVWFLDQDIYFGHNFPDPNRSRRLTKNNRNDARTMIKSIRELVEYTEEELIDNSPFYSSSGDLPANVQYWAQQFSCFEQSRGYDLMGMKDHSVPLNAGQLFIRLTGETRALYGEILEDISTRNFNMSHGWGRALAPDDEMMWKNMRGYFSQKGDKPEGEFVRSLSESFTKGIDGVGMGTDQGLLAYHFVLKRAKALQFRSRPCSKLNLNSEGNKAWHDWGGGKIYRMATEYKKDQLDTFLYNKNKKKIEMDLLKNYYYYLRDALPGIRRFQNKIGCTSDAVDLITKKARSCFVVDHCLNLFASKAHIYMDALEHWLPEEAVAANKKNTATLPPGSKLGLAISELKKRKIVK